MKRNFFVFLIVSIMVLNLFGCAQQTSTESIQSTQAQSVDTQPPATESETDTATPLLYRVSDKNGNVLWLFGSIHVGREDYYPLPDYVMDAYHGCDALAVEADIVAFETDFAAQTKAMQKLIYTDGTDISDHIPEELYDEAVSIMEEADMYISMLDYYMPSMWFSFLQSLMYLDMDAQIELGIDRHFLTLAKEEEKEILEVESVEFQYDMLAGFSEELQIFLLRDAVQSYKLSAFTKIGIDLLMNQWAAGDEEAFGKYLQTQDESVEQMDADLYNEYYNAMYLSRNEAMTRWAEDALQSGKEIFMVVGAAHIVGEGAVAENLRELGYTVEIVR